MSDEEQERHLPFYPSSSQMHIASREQQKPMMKLLGRMVRQMKKPGKAPAKTAPRHGRAGKKGLQANQSVNITHKTIFY
jgi:hypothetical protein